MKKFLVFVLLVSLTGMVFAQNSVNLDRGIEDAANFLNERIPARTSVAVFNFTADSKKLSDYIVDELTIALTNTGLDVFDRNNLDAVNREIYYSMSPAVNDDTAQRYGKDVGVNTVVLGSITKAGNNEYRLRIQAIVVETKKIQAGRTINIRQDERLLSLLDIKIQKEYRFSSKEKATAGLKNMAFGWGSFSMGDPLGGGVTLGLEAASIAVIVVGITMDTSVPYDNIIGQTYDEYLASQKATEAERDKLIKKRNTMIICGGGGVLLSWTWGFVRPFLYDKPTAVQKIANVIDHTHFGVMPAADGNVIYNLSFGYSF